MVHFFLLVAFSKSKNADWTDKFLYFRLLSSSEVRYRWNLSKIGDKLDETIVIPGFDVLEGYWAPRKLNSNFDKRTLVRVGLS